MYEKIAWENFCKTGDVESFIEYRKIMEMNNNVENATEKEIGDVLSEFNKNQGDSNKGDNL